MLLSNDQKPVAGNINIAFKIHTEIAVSGTIIIKRISNSDVRTILSRNRVGAERRVRPQKETKWTTTQKYPKPPGLAMGCCQHSRPQSISMYTIYAAHRMMSSSVSRPSQ